MKKLNPHVLYVFGQRLAPLIQVKEHDKLGAHLFALEFARDSLKEFVAENTMLPQASHRAASELIKAISKVLPEDWTKADREKVLNWSDAYYIRKNTEDLNTVLQNDMPGISVYLVSQKGIYKTDDLIIHAEHALLESVRKDLSEQAKLDIREAGKCLAYELPIACAFHMYRAMEEVMRVYYSGLAGMSFKDAKVRRGWDSYIKALIDAGAESKITQFLDHIRSEYRNPQTHPDESITIGEAFGLFGAALSSISQMILATQELKKSGPKIVRSAGEV